MSVLFSQDKKLFPSDNPANLDGCDNLFQLVRQADATEDQIRSPAMILFSLAPSLHCLYEQCKRPFNFHFQYSKREKITNGSLQVGQEGQKLKCILNFSGKRQWGIWSQMPQSSLLLQ